MLPVLISLRRVGPYGQDMLPPFSANDHCWTALEAFLRHSDAYSTLGMVQGAFGVSFAPAFAQRAAEVAAKKRIYVATSSCDPYQKLNHIFARELLKRQADVSYVERKGPHNQDWLRQIGTLDLLIWHERVLNAI